jgi:tetratricopeptide (TPR) repeat protein
MSTEPESATVHYNLGNTLRDKGDVGGAIEEYRAAIRLQPDFIEAHRELGQVLRNEGEIHGAIAEFREVVHLNPTSSTVHIVLGHALASKGDTGGAMAEYREALRLTTNSAEAHFGLGMLLEDTGSLDGAIAEYRETLRLYPNHDQAHYFLGRALGRKGESQHSLEDMAMTESNQAPQPNAKWWARWWSSPLWRLWGTWYLLGGLVFPLGYLGIGKQYHPSIQDTVEFSVFCLLLAMQALARRIEDVAKRIKP